MALQCSGEFQHCDGCDTFVDSVAFLPYPRLWHKRELFAHAPQRTCAHPIIAMKEELPTYGKQRMTERNRDSDKSVEESSLIGPYSKSFRDIATRIGEARDQFRRASDEAQALESSPEGFVLGSDFSKLRIGSTSLIQDLEVPPAPRYWGLSPDEVLAALEVYMRKCGYHEDIANKRTRDLRDILADLRGWTFQFADQARPLLELTADQGDESNRNTVSDAVDALATLLQLSGFAVLPDIPAITEPPCPEALPLGNSIEQTLDPTILCKSSVVSKHIRSHGVHIGSPSYYPHLFLATRGVSLVRKSGMLIPQKLRAIERTYFSWITTPFAFLVEPFRALTCFFRDQFLKGVKNHGRNTSKGAELEQRNGTSAGMEGRVTQKRDGKRVRRVVPAVQLDGGLGALTKLFLPTFTQEPAYELLLLLYREVDLDKDSIRKTARTALRNQVKASVAQAVNPVPSKRCAPQTPAVKTEGSVFDTFEQPIGTLKPVTLQMFADVQWGTMKHFFPSTFILPATTDLLRIDALTFLGLVSTVVTYGRNADNAFVYALLTGTIVTYAMRVAFGWRSALIDYRGRIAHDRAQALVSRQGNTLVSLAAMAAEEQFPDVCCVWLSGILRNGKQPEDLQQEVFGATSLNDEAVASWREWLKCNDYPRNESS